MKKFAIAALPLILSACAITPEPEIKIAATPTCASQAECDVKWAAARTYVLEHARIKIETYSSDYMSTFNSIGDSVNLAASVNRAPMPDGTYSIVAKFYCGNQWVCDPRVPATLNGFNETLNAIRVQ